MSVQKATLRRGWRQSSVIYRGAISDLVIAVGRAFALLLNLRTDLFGRSSKLIKELELFELRLEGAFC